MRSEKEVYDIVLNFAQTDKRIRMVTLEGSRTNTNIPPAIADGLRGASVLRRPEELRGPRRRTDHFFRRQRIDSHVRLSGRLS